MTAESQFEVLTYMRELLADPERVVLDPTSTYENAYGAVITYEDAVSDPHSRVCLYGSVWVASRPHSTVVRRQVGDLVSITCEAHGFADEGAAFAQGQAVKIVDACLKAIT